MAAPEPDGQKKQTIESSDFVRLLLKHERRLRGFLLTVMPGTDDLDDILQEVSLLAWEKHSEFSCAEGELDEAFVAWLCTIGKFKVYNLRRKVSRSKVVFSDELVEQLAAIQAEMSDELETRHTVLMSCVSKLQTDEREMLRRRYFAEESVQEVAVWMERSSDTVYKALNRVRAKLMRCMERTIRLEGGGT